MIKKEQAYDMSYSLKLKGRGKVISYLEMIIPPEEMNVEEREGKLMGKTGFSHLYLLF